MQEYENYIQFISIIYTTTNITGILAHIPQYGNIYHSNYSENMTQLYKYEVQSVHFNKRPYSLHCTVEHQTPDVDATRSQYLYHYHFSNDMTHDFAYSSLIFNHLSGLNTVREIIRRKPDN